MRKAAIKVDIEAIANINGKRRVDWGVWPLMIEGVKSKARKA
jgi:hypothetical protein